MKYNINLFDSFVVGPLGIDKINRIPIRRTKPRIVEVDGDHAYHWTTTPHGPVITDCQRRFAIIAFSLQKSKAKKLGNTCHCKLKSDQMARSFFNIWPLV